MKNVQTLMRENLTQMVITALITRTHQLGAKNLSSTTSSRKNFAVSVVVDRLGHKLRQTLDLKNRSQSSQPVGREDQ